MTLYMYAILNLGERNLRKKDKQWLKFPIKVKVTCFLIFVNGYFNLDLDFVVTTLVYPSEP